MKLSDRWDAVLAIPIKNPAKAVLGVLARRANDKTGKSFSSLSRLAVDAGVSPRSASRGIVELEKLGFLEVTRPTHQINHFKVSLGAFRAVLLTKAAAILAGGSRHIGGQNLPVNLPKAKTRKRKIKLGSLCHVCHRAVPIDGKAGKCWTCYSKDNPRIQRPYNVRNPDA